MAVEEEEDEESSTDEEEIFGRNTNDKSARNLTGAQALMSKDLDDKHFPQAFSHFSYVHSKRHFMVVDLHDFVSMAFAASSSFFWHLNLNVHMLRAYL